MLRFSGSLYLLFGLFFLSACSVFDKPMKAENPQLVASPDKVSLMLAEAADRASVALETLAAVEQSKSPAIAIEPITNAPEELTRAVTISWVGPVEPITKTLADRAGYNFQSVGSAPPIPVVVSVDVENRPVIDVLRSIGLQLGMRADIKVDGQRKVVEVHYAPNEGVENFGG
jgi:defect-in-organelle-trafficking protein DotD